MHSVSNAYNIGFLCHM